MMIRTLITLYFAFWKVGTFAFGGGLAVLKLIEQNLVRDYGWLTTSQFVELVSLSEATPGPIAVNAATFAGVLVAGIPGAIVATLGVVTTSFLLMTLLARVIISVKDHDTTKAFFLGLRPIAAGLVVSAAIAIGKEAINSEVTAVMAAAGFLASYKFKAHPILLIAIAAVAGILFF